VYTPEEAVRDPHLKARNMITEVDHPTMGRAKQIGSMIKLSESKFEARYWSQRFGQHTDEILLELGYKHTRIEELRATDIIS
jgi:crotonobetainyl-CoA:carnitine CoA-transferase CaiB-like acyl-CoA transferase